MDLPTHVVAREIPLVFFSIVIDCREGSLGSARFISNSGSVMMVKLGAVCDFFGGGVGGTDSGCCLFVL